MNYARLNSESEIDRFLNHLDNDTLLGLQHRLSPIEYAIHVIKSRTQSVNINDNGSTNSDETVPTNNLTNGNVNEEPEVTLDEPL